MLNILFFCKRFDLIESSSLAAYASFGFDVNMHDMFAPLMVGATFHIIPNDMRLDMDRLNDYYERNKISHQCMTTQVGRQFASTVQNHSFRYAIPSRSGIE